MSTKVTQLMVEAEFAAQSKLEEALTGLPIPDSVSFGMSKFKNESVRVTVENGAFKVVTSYIMVSHKSLPEAMQVACILIADAVANKNVLQNPRSKLMRDLFDSKGVSADRGIDFNEAPYVEVSCDNPKCSAETYRTFSAKRKDPICMCGNTLTQVRINWNYRLDANFVNEFGVPKNYRWGDDKEHIEEIFKSSPKESRTFLTKLYKENGWAVEEEPKPEVVEAKPEVVAAKPKVKAKAKPKRKAPARKRKAKAKAKAK